ASVQATRASAARSRCCGPSPRASRRPSPSTPAPRASPRRVSPGYRRTRENRAGPLRREPTARPRPRPSPARAATRACAPSDCSMRTPPAVAAHHALARMAALPEHHRRAHLPAGERRVLATQPLVRRDRREKLLEQIAANPEPDLPLLVVARLSAGLV